MIGGEQLPAVRRADLIAFSLPPTVASDHHLAVVGRIVPLLDDMAAGG